jgi:hypothetical protein
VNPSLPDGICVALAGFDIKNMGWVLAYGIVNASYPIITKLVRI